MFLWEGVLLRSAQTLTCFTLRSSVCRPRKGSIGARKRYVPQSQSQPRALAPSALTLREIVTAAAKELVLKTQIPSTADKRTFLRALVHDSLVDALRCKSSGTMPCALPGASTLCGWHNKAQTQRGHAKLLQEVNVVRDHLRCGDCSLTALLPVSSVLRAQLSLPARSSLVDYLTSFNSHILSNHQLKQLQQQHTLQRHDGDGYDATQRPTKSAFAEHSLSSAMTRSTEYCSSIAAYLGQQHTVSGGLRSLRDATGALLEAKAATDADTALPKPATAARWVKLEDEHYRRKAAELLHGKPIVLTLDSGKKSGENYVPFAVAAYIPEDNLVYTETISVELIPGSAAEDYDDARQRAFAKAGLDEQHVLGVNSDSAPNLVGCNAGANELARRRLDSPLALDFPCLAHGFERCFKYGLVGMTGEPSEG